MSVAENLLEEQARALATAARVMRETPESPSIVGKTEELENLISLALALVKVTERLRVVYWRRFLANQIPNVDAAGRRLLHLAVEVGLALQDLLRASHIAGTLGLDVDGAEDCKAALARMQELQEELRERWPMVDPEEVERSRAEFAAGRFVTLEDLMRELDDPVQ